MRTFAELLSEYVARTGISDAELARSIGVRRQTIFRWKEGLVTRPRHRDDVLRCARRLRLTPEEQNALLVAAGFPPQAPPSSPGQPAPSRLPAPELPPQVEEPIILDVYRPGRFLPPLVWVAVAVVLVASFSVAFFLTRSLRLNTRYPLAGEGETLIVVGRFVNYVGGPSGYNVAGRLQTALEREIEAADLAGVRVAVWPEEISDAAAAEDVRRRSQATVVVWGEYDSGRVLARFTIPGAGSEPGERQWEELVASPSDLSATINSALPTEVRYVALLTLGQLYTDQENYEQARAVLTQALAQPPTEADALALLYFQLGTIHQVGEPVDFDQAIDYYSRVLALQPGWVAATNNRGVAYLDRGRVGDLDRSISDLTQAIAGRPDYAVAYTNRGAAYLERMEDGDVGRALEDLGHAVELAPDSYTAFINRGAAYLERGQAGDAQRAVEDFSRAIQLAPDAAGGYLNRGLAYIQQAERERWLEDLGRALALEKDNAGILNALCWGYALDQEPDLALPYCQQSLALDPNGYARDSLGVVYAQLGRLDEAAREFEAFLDWLQEEPDSVYSHHGPVREAWLRELEAGRNPIDAETLEQLRVE